MALNVGDEVVLHGTGWAKRDWEYQRVTVAGFTEGFPIDGLPYFEREGGRWYLYRTRTRSGEPHPWGYYRDAAKVEEPKADKTELASKIANLGVYVDALARISAISSLDHERLTELLDEISEAVVSL